MDKVSGKLTVYFEEPFWVGVFERIEDGVQSQKITRCMNIFQNTILIWREK